EIPPGGAVRRRWTRSWGLVDAVPVVDPGLLRVAHGFSVPLRFLSPVTTRLATVEGRVLVVVDGVLGSGELAHGCALEVSIVEETPTTGPDIRYLRLTILTEPSGIVIFRSSSGLRSSGPRVRAPKP